VIVVPHCLRQVSDFNLSKILEGVQQPADDMSSVGAANPRWLVRLACER
jgi:hypothetical protein